MPQASILQCSTTIRSFTPEDPFALLARLRREMEDGAANTGGIPPVIAPPVVDTPGAVVYVATTNRAKLRTLEAHLEQAALTPVGWPLPLVEPQALTCADVAVAKARQAYALTGRAVLVHDAAFHLEGFGGFPGVYSRDAVSALGPAGLVALGDAANTRRTFFTEAVAVCPAGMDVYLWHGRAEHGRLATRDELDAEVMDPQATLSPLVSGWSAIGHVFIPEGFDRPLARLTESERAAYLAGDSGRRLAIRSASSWLADHGMEHGVISVTHPASMARHETAAAATRAWALNALSALGQALDAPAPAAGASLAGQSQGPLYTTG